MGLVTEQTKTTAAPRFFHPTNPVLTSHDFTKSIYLNLLESFPPEDVASFWKSLPMQWEGQTLSTHQLLSHMWQKCAYDAPVCLLTIRHKNSITYSSDVLNHLVLDLEEDEPPLEKTLLARHEALLGSLMESVELRIFPKDESISLNGKHFVKGVSAKILRSLISAYLKDGRCEFEYREFKRDFEISLGQKNSNFEVRFYRLVEKLEEKCPSIVIEKKGRGRFTLAVNAKLSFEE